MGLMGAKASIIVTGQSMSPITIVPETTTGLEAIYVVYDTNGSTLSYRPENGESATSISWFRFSTLGGGYAEPVASTIVDELSTIPLTTDDMGYIVAGRDGRQHCYWIVNYANHHYEISGVTIDETESDCSSTAINIHGNAGRITYYTINGIPRDLSRDIAIEYNTLTWNEDATNYYQENVTTTFAYLSATARVQAPLCDTRFKITGDRFLRQWGMTEEIETDFYTAMAVEAHTTASQTEREVDNEITDNTGDLGGSAPAEIEFKAIPSDAVVFREWQFSRFPDFDIIDLRFNQDELTYTFRDNGSTYVRYLAANASGNCEYVSDSYHVEIGESRLLCPNAFSPGASEGINDEWKVSYKSIISYECHIFNRWGVELFSSTDPTQGWDGKYKGKVVPAGVYFYVIKARGADGKDYSLSGDINIINYKKNSNTPQTTE